MRIQKKIKSAFCLKIILLTFFCILHSDIRTEQQYKELEIEGLLIHAEQYLIIQLKLSRLPANRNHFESVAKKLNDFYHAGGYVLAETFLLEETGGRLRVFVDEGRLGTIVFKKLSTPMTLRMKYEFRLNQRIYNKYVIDKKLRRLEKKFGFDNIKEEIKRAPEYDRALIQLDDKFVLPWFGPAMLPFPEKIGYRYNLYLNFNSDQKSRKEKTAIDLDIKTSYSKGFIPRIEFYDPSIFMDDDLLVAGASAGIRYGYYGLDVDFARRPEWTFMEAHADYNIAPAFKEYFTPMIRGAVNNSRASRHDLGLEEYKFVVLKGTAAPGITLLKKWKIYAGLGAERVYIYDSAPDPDAGSPMIIKEHIEDYAFLETRLIYELSWLPPGIKGKQIEFAYRYYWNDKIFNEISIESSSDYELRYLSIYTLAFDYAKIWKRPPFYHEEPVSNQNFKGLMSEDYYTRDTARNSHEIKTSLYRAYIYGGLFTDLVWFRGSGYDLTGNHYGLVAGISGHVIFLDQFQFDIYFGKDCLFPEKDSRYNIYMKLFRKW